MSKTEADEKSHILLLSFSRRLHTLMAQEINLENVLSVELAATFSRDYVEDIYRRANPHEQV